MFTGIVSNQPLIVWRQGPWIIDGTKFDAVASHVVPMDELLSEESGTFPTEIPGRYEFVPSITFHSLDEDIEVWRTQVARNVVDAEME